MPDDWLEFHVREEIAGDVDAGRDLDQPYSRSGEFKYGAFRDVENLLPTFFRVARREGDSIHLLHPFPNRAGLFDPQGAVFPCDPAALRVEGAAENDLLGILGDLHEPTRAHQISAEMR